MPVSRGTGRSRRVLRFLLAATLSVRVILLFAILAVAPSAESLLLPDAPRYVTEGRNLLAYGILSQDPVPPITPTMFDVPVYPLIVAGALFLFGPASGIVAVLLFNIACVTLSVYVLYLIASQLYGARTGLIAAGLLGIWPSTLFYVLMAMPDVLFLLLFLLLVYFLLAYQMTQSTGHAVLAAAFLGVSVLTKPVGMWFGVIAALWIAAMRGRKAITNACLFTGITLVILSPWVARNYVVFGSLSVSNAADAHLYMQYVRMASMLRRVPAEQVMTPDVLELRARYDENFHSVPPAESAVLRRYAIVGLRDHLAFYIGRVHLGNAYMFLGTATSGLFRLFGVDLAPKWTAVVESYITSGLRAVIVRVLEDRQLAGYFVLQTASTLLVVFVCTLAAVGLWRGARALGGRALALPVACVVYFFVVTGGTFSNSRYALPMAPFVSLIAAGSLKGTRPDSSS